MLLMKKNQSPEMLALEAQRRRLTRSKRRPSKRAPSTRVSPSQQQGYAKENQAAVFLQQQGLEILEKNVHNVFGEIDIVARSANTLVFIEVRARSNPHYGGARSSVSLAKQQRLKRTALHLLSGWSTRYFEGITPCCRFDVIAFEGESLIWIQDAFR